MQNLKNLFMSKSLELSELIFRSRCDSSDLTLPEHLSDNSGIVSVTTSYDFYRSLENSTSSRTSIYLDGHGDESNGEHFIKLEEYLPTASILKPIINTPVAVHVFSCHAGYAAKEASHLPKGSVLIAHADESTSHFGSNRDAIINTMQYNLANPSRTSRDVLDYNKILSTLIYGLGSGCSFSFSNQPTIRQEIFSEAVNTILYMLGSNCRVSFNEPEIIRLDSSIYKINEVTESNDKLSEYVFEFINRVADAMEIHSESNALVSFDRSQVSQIRIDEEILKELKENLFIHSHNLFKRELTDEISTFWKKPGSFFNKAVCYSINHKKAKIVLNLPFSILNGIPYIQFEYTSRLRQFKLSPELTRSLLSKYISNSDLLTKFKIIYPTEYKSLYKSTLKHLIKGSKLKIEEQEAQEKILRKILPFSIENPEVLKLFFECCKELGFIEIIKKILETKELNLSHFEFSYSNLEALSELFKKLNDLGIAELRICGINFSTENKKNFLKWAKNNKFEEIFKNIIISFQDLKIEELTAIFTDEIISEIVANFGKYIDIFNKKNIRKALLQHEKIISAIADNFVEFGYLLNFEDSRAELLKHTEVISAIAANFDKFRLLLYFEDSRAELLKHTEVISAIAANFDKFRFLLSSEDSRAELLKHTEVISAIATNFETIDFFAPDSLKKELFSNEEIYKLLDKSQKARAKYFLKTITAKEIAGSEEDAALGICTAGSDEEAVLGRGAAGSNEEVVVIGDHPSE
jgi:hypothetical protein